MFDDSDKGGADIVLLQGCISNLVDAAVVCAIRESISGLEPSSVIIEPRYLKRVTI